MYSFHKFEPVYCSMSGSNCCFLTCIQISQEAGQAVWYSHVFQNFPQFVVIHTIKDFNVVSEAEVDFFLEFSCFFYDPSVQFSSVAQSCPTLCDPMNHSRPGLPVHQILAIWSRVPLPFLNPACISGSSLFTYCWSLSWRFLSTTLLACEMSAIVQ